MKAGKTEMNLYDNIKQNWSGTVVDTKKIKGYLFVDKWNFETK